MSGVLSAARVARVLSDVRVHRAVLRERAARIAEGATAVEAASSRARCAELAHDLHGFYTAFEALGERVARDLDGDVPTGPGSHASLLQQLAVEVPGVRVRVLDPDALRQMDALRRFRHFLRHAYAVELEPEPLLARAADVAAAGPALERGLDAFEAFLEGVLAHG